jgi:hypothetical protein
MTTKPPPGWALVVDGWAPGDNVYPHPTGTYNVTRLYHVAREAEIICGPFRIAMPLNPISHLLREPNVNLNRALAIPLETATADPMLLIQLPTRHLLVVDGHERLLRMACAGITVFKSYVVPPGFQPPLISPQTRRIADCSADQIASQNIAKDLLARFPK